MVKFIEIKNYNLDKTYINLSHIEAIDQHQIFMINGKSYNYNDTYPELVKRIEELTKGQTNV